MSTVDSSPKVMEQIEIHVPPETELMIQEAAAFEKMQAALQSP